MLLSPSISLHFHALKPFSLYCEFAGFIDPLGVCCGKHGDSVVHCGMKAVVDGKEVYGQPCSEPAKYISWDGVHFTHAANQWVAHRILDGSFSDPPFPINQVCQKHPSS